MPQVDRLIPVVTYQDIPAAHDFLVRAFGFQPYGQREYGARDLEGHRWWFGAPTVVRANE